MLNSSFNFWLWLSLHLEKFWTLQISLSVRSLSSSCHHNHHHHHQQRYYLHWLQCDSAASGNIFSFWLLFLSLFVRPKPYPTPLSPPLLSVHLFCFIRLQLLSRRHRERLLERQPVVEEEEWTTNTAREEEREHVSRDKHRNMQCR